MQLAYVYTVRLVSSVACSSLMIEAAKKTCKTLRSFVCVESNTRLTIGR